MKLIGDIARKIGSVFKKIFLSLWNLILIIWTGIKKVSKSIYSFIKKISIFLWDNLLKYPFIFLKKITSLIYKGLSYIFKKLEILLAPVGRLLLNILKFIWNVLKIIGRFFRLIFRYIWKGVKWLITTIARGINIVLDKVVEFFVWLYKILKKCFIAVVNFFKYGFRSFPDGGYRFSMNGLINLMLVFHFILYVIPRFIIITIPYEAYLVIIKVLNPVITFIYNCLKTLGKAIKSILVFLYEKTLNFLYVIVEQIYLIAPYYYVLLLSPIVIPIFILLASVALIYSLFVSILLFFKSVLNFNHNEYNEILDVKNQYYPSINIHKLSNNYYKNLKYDYISSTKIKNSWIIVNLIVWQLIYKYLVIVIYSIVLLPITLIMFIFYKIKYNLIKNDLNKYVEKRIKTNEINGLIKNKKYTFFGKKLEIKVSNSTYDDELDLFILNNEKTNIDIVYNNEIILNKEIKYNTNENYELYNMFNEIKNRLKDIKNYEFMLPSISNDNIQISYETTRRDDLIKDFLYTLRPNGDVARIKVFLKSKNNTLEREIFVDTIINSRLISEEVLNKKLINIKKGESFLKFLDKRLEYIFIENENINKDGKIKKLDDGLITVSFYIKDLPVRVYNVEVFVLTNEKDFNYYLSQLEIPKFDYENQKMILNFEITNRDNSKRNVSWFINGNEVYPDDSFDLHHRYYGVQKRYTATAVFSFNNKLVTKHFEFSNPTNKKEIHYKYALSEIIKSIDYLETDEEIKFQTISKSMRYYKKSHKKNNNYLYLPVFGESYVFVIKWKSLNPDIINSSGKIYKVTNDKVFFEVVMYRNIFNNKKFVIEYKREKNNA
ncbi:hypothetical protein [Haploplasma axanthum]|uniref:Uncharacterized protein n=1 Tax=Haploplasma axanthum TaxID=29552 RepID=A0A449BDD3_HAPAX|nr:hypothetical protein [Haploplasma axanthum]VEU80438.1 Uncharacterised protein [Haploplasma axanthum]